jgi:hypothetical protein
MTHHDDDRFLLRMGYALIGGAALVLVIAVIMAHILWWH